MSFPTTHWSALAPAVFDHNTAARDALDQLCPRSWSSLNQFIRARGYSEADAIRGSGLKTLPSPSVTITTLLLALLFALGVMRCAAESYIWNGVNGDWSVAANWTPNGVPGGADSATITGGTATLNADTTLRTLAFSGGTIEGAGSLTVSSDLTWTGGNMSGSGPTRVAAEATASVSGSNPKFLSDGRRFENAGRLTWLDGDIIFSGGGGSRWINLSGGVWDIQCDQALKDDCNQYVAVENHGLLRKSAGLGESRVPINGGNCGHPGTSLMNAGTVEVQTGTFTTHAISSSVTHSGSFQVVAGATLNFASGEQALTGTLIGPGLVRVSGANVLANAPQSFPQLIITAGSFAANTNVTVEQVSISGGAIAGTGLFTVASNLTWTNGGMSGSGTTRVATGATASVSGSNPKFLSDGRRFENAGRLTWLDGDIIFSGGGGSRWINLSGGVWDIQCDQALKDDCNQYVAVENHGLLRKSASLGESRVPINGGNCGHPGTSLMNAGTVEVQTGTFTTHAISSSVTHSGSFQVVAGATLNFASGEHLLGPGSSLSGTGTVYFRTPITLGADLNFGALQVVFQDNASLSGPFILANTSGGTMMFNKSMTVPGCVVIGGTMTNANSVETVTINCKLELQSGATLNNPGTVRVGRFDNNGGTVIGNAPVLLGTALQITPATTNLNAGQVQTFVASGGIPGYFFTLAQNNSGGGITSNGIYTAGATTSVSDTILVTDAANCTATATAVVSPPPCIPAPAGLVSWWPGDGNAMDLAGTNHGRLINGATFAPGLVGQAFNFDGNDDLVSAPDSPQWNFGSGDFTIELWMKLNRVKNSMFIHQQNGAVEGGFEFNLQPTTPAGSILAFSRDSGNTSISRSWSPSVDQWYHLAVTRRQSVYRLYVNGSPLGSEATDPNPVADVTGPLRIGNHAGDPSFGVDGIIDELSIHDRAVSSNEIAAIYAAGNAGMCKPTSGFTGAPRMLVNGRVYFANIATVTNSALLRMESSESNAVIRYTLNGAPPANGALYTGPFIVTQAVVVRAMAFNVAGVASPQVGPVQLDVIAPPAILLQPQDQLVGAGEDVVFAALAAGMPSPQLQWLRNGIAVAGATNAVLLLTNVLPGPPANFALVASNAFGMVTSAVARLDVLAPPTMVAQPASVTAAVGGTATFSVSAFGPPPLEFQWRKNGANIEGATSSTLTISPVQLDDGASYSVVIASPGGTLISDAALLIVPVPSPPAHDNFAAANALSGASGSATGTNHLTTREVGEPMHAGKPGSNSVWYTWTPTANGIATFRTVGSTFDTLLGVYLGTNVAATTLVGSDEDSGGFLTSKVRFNATNGVTYHIAIDGFNGAQGNFVLRWELMVTNATLPEMTCPPASRTVPLGQDAGFSVSARGVALTYEWFFNGTAIGGATGATYTRSNAQPEHVGFYTVRVSNASQQTVESTAAILELGPFAEQQSRDKTDDVTVSCPGSLRPAAGGASSVAMGSIGFQVLVSVSTNNVTDCNTTFCSGIPTGTRYLELSPATSGTFLLDTAGSASRTKLWICDAGTSRLSPRTFIECDVESAADGRSLARFSAVGGRNYQVYIARLDDAVGVLRLNWKLGVPPRLVSLSADRFVGEGQSMTLNVEATNVVAHGVTTALAPPSYQWLFNGTLLGTGPTLTVTQMQAAMAGRYQVVAGNDLGTTSAVVRVEVHGETSRAVVNTGASTELFAADTTAACGGTPTTYQWRRNATLLPGETRRNLVLGGTQPENAGEYTVTVINCFGTVSYTVARVAVTVDVGFEAELLSGGLVGLRWRTTPGKRYRVEFRPSFDPSAWMALLPDITAGGANQQITDPLGTVPRFYRIVLFD